MGNPTHVLVIISTQLAIAISSDGQCLHETHNVPSFIIQAFNFLVHSNVVCMSCSPVSLVNLPDIITCDKAAGSEGRLE